MPHARKRHLETLVASALKWSPAVGLWGMRQTGKSFFASGLTAKLGGAYETLDRSATLSASNDAPMQFLERPKLLCIDEVQKAAWLFPAIKDVIGLARRPGRFLLTGSVRFTAKKDVNEALTGRILMHELLPFTVSEARQNNPSIFLRLAFEAIPLAKVSPAGERKLFEVFISRLRETEADHIASHALRGGLPIPCFTRDEARRSAWYHAYVETLLTRDVVLVDPRLARLPFRQASIFFQELAAYQGREANLSELSARGGIPRLQASRLFDALQVLAVIDPIPANTGSSIKAARKPSIEWKDSGLWAFVAGVAKERFSTHPAALPLAFSHEWRAQIGLMDKPCSWTTYRHRDGARVPWIFRSKDRTCAITYVPAETPPPYEYRALKRFLSRRKDGLGFVLGSPRTRPTILAGRIWLLPYTMVF